MIGMYNLVLSTGKVSYNLKLERQITVVKGESGTGKSLLYKMLQQASTGLNFKDLGIRCNLEGKIETLDLKGWQDKISSSRGKIFILDEFLSFVNTLEFADLVSYSDNYFVIISRSGRLRYLTYAATSIVEMSDVNGVNEFVERYENKRESLIPDVVITEDSNSGYSMYSNILNCPVISAYGKDNIPKVVRANLIDDNIVFVIADGAAFGSIITALFPTYSGKKLYVFLPESFEWLLLKSGIFSRDLNDELVRPYDFCDTTKYISWEPYFTDLLTDVCKKHRVDYSKKRLNKFFLRDEFKTCVRGALSDIDESCFAEG